MSQQQRTVLIKGNLDLLNEVDKISNHGSIPPATYFFVVDRPSSLADMVNGLREHLAGLELAIKTAPTSSRSSPQQTSDYASQLSLLDLNTPEETPIPVQPGTPESARTPPPPPTTSPPPASTTASPPKTPTPTPSPETPEQPAQLQQPTASTPPRQPSITSPPITPSFTCFWSPPKGLSASRYNPANNRVPKPHKHAPAKEWVPAPGTLVDMPAEFVVEQRRETEGDGTSVSSEQMEVFVANLSMEG